MTWDNDTTRRGFLKAGAGAVAATTASSITLTYPAGASKAEGTTVTIKRDGYGVPHVFARGADGRPPVFYGYGYAAAEDRLFQMEMYRRKYYGTTAEVLGAGEKDRWVNFDRASRMNRSGSDVPAQIKNDLNDENRAVLEAFAAGINRYIEDVREGDREFHKAFDDFDFEPDTWDREDVAGMFVSTLSFFMGFQLETFGSSLLSLLKKEYDEDTAEELFMDIQPGEDPGAPTTGEPANVGYQPPFTPPAADADSVPREDGSSGSGPSRGTGGGSGGESPGKGRGRPVGDHRIPADPESAHEAFVDHQRVQARGLDELGLALKIGSNALAVHGDATESGDALLYGGPQMGFSSPSVQHEVGLHGPDFDVTGITVAGYPAVMFGHNDHGAWTSTAGIDNMIQTFVERIREAPENADENYQYEFKGEWYPVEEQTETIEVKDSDDREVTVRRTRHGVVMQWNPPSEGEDDGEAIAWTRSYEGQEMRGLKAFYDAQFATDAEEFVEASKQGSYSVNFLWAGEDGDIAYSHLGRYVDWEAVDWDTRLPADGTQYELTDDQYNAAADDDVPNAIMEDPEEFGRAYMANWNNKPAPDWDNGDLSYAWGTDHRVQRIMNLTERQIDDGGMSYEDMKDIVYDIAFVDLRAIRYKDDLLAALEGADLSDVEKDAKEALETWDNFQRGSGEDFFGDYPPGFTVFDATFPKILENAFAPTFGSVFGIGQGLFFDYRYGRPLLMRTLNADQAALEPAVDYFGKDDDPSDELLAAFRSAVGELKDDLGEDVEEWTRSAAVEELDNLALFGMPIGVSDPGEMPFQNRGTENHFVRCGNDLPESAERNQPFVAENVLPPGNSGYVAPDGTQDEHYADQLQLFIDFEYKRLRFSEAEVNRDLESTQTLTPGNNGDRDRDSGNGDGGNGDGGNDPGRGHGSKGGRGR